MAIDRLRPREENNVVMIAQPKPNIVPRPLEQTLPSLPS
jgi:hypothetical protein